VILHFRKPPDDPDENMSAPNSNSARNDCPRSCQSAKHAEVDPQGNDRKLTGIADFKLFVDFASLLFTQTTMRSYPASPEPFLSIEKLDLEWAVVAMKNVSVVSVDKMTARDVRLKFLD